LPFLLKAAGFSREKSVSHNSRLSFQYTSIGSINY